MRPSRAWATNPGDNKRAPSMQTPTNWPIDLLIPKFIAGTGE
ncbi:unannotated protein [freshwater metagenome]|uniref:Unannotated protein n=1 Tax=freshwater metagenome TaxID=449393 RepID=A0A6J7H229_9ZZZZ